jgi:hypothetical protein
MTVSPPARYDINTAPAELLEAAGVTHAMVQNIIEARRSRPFTSTEDAQRRVKSLGNVKTKLLESNGILFPLWNPGEERNLRVSPDGKPMVLSAVHKPSVLGEERAPEEGLIGTTPLPKHTSDGDVDDDGGRFRRSTGDRVKQLLARNNVGDEARNLDPAPKEASKASEVQGEAKPATADEREGKDATECEGEGGGAGEEKALAKADVSNERLTEGVETGSKRRRFFEKPARASAKQPRTSSPPATRRSPRDHSTCSHTNSRSQWGNENEGKLDTATEEKPVDEPSPRATRRAPRGTGELHVGL